MRALSIRQPWAWLIVNGYKDIENRGWPTLVREWVLIHASSTMTPAEWTEAMQFAHKRGVGVPLPAALERGGIIGAARLCGCVKASKSRWFTGPYGLVFREPWPLPFMKCRGELGFFTPETPLANLKIAA